MNIDVPKDEEIRLTRKADGSYWIAQDDQIEPTAVMTVSEAAEILKKSRRQVYRYMEQGIVESVECILGEWLLDAESVNNLKDRPLKTQPIPAFLQKYFPEYEVKNLNLGQSQSLVAGRVLEHGGLRDFKWLQKRVGVKSLKAFLSEDGARLLSPRAYRFWCLYFGVEPKSQKAKSETWRSR